MTVPDIASLDDIDQYLDRFRDQAHTKYNLDNMRQLMAYLGDPQNKLRVVHVAGTSGKTSTSYYVAALLTAAGRKVGLTVSPHINQINERVQINGQPLAERLFCEAIGEFFDLVEKAPLQPSRFEFMVAFAYWYFALVKVDYAVIEVGLGGLKDGTNVISRADKVCVITDIGYDHINVLGKTLPEIAAHKAGIIQPRNQIFSYAQSPEVMQVISNAAAAQKASLKIVEPAKNNQPDVPDYQFRNGFLAYQVYLFLKQRDGLPKLSDAQLKQVRDILIPGRMEVTRQAGKTVILDGAHNSQKITAMADSFKKLYPNQKPAVLISLRNGKDYEEVAPIIAALASRIIVTSFDLGQDVPVHSMDVDVLAASLEAAGAANVARVMDQTAALRQLLADPEDVCLVTGSLYLIGQLKKRGLV